MSTEPPEAPRKAKSNTAPPPPPVGEVGAKWVRHCEKEWKHVSSATLLMRRSNHQKEPTRIKDYSVRSNVDDAELAPEHSPVSLAMEARSDATRNCESGPLAAYYGLQLWAWEKGQHKDLGCVWEWIDLAASGSAGDQHLALVGILRGSLIEVHADYHKLAQELNGIMGGGAAFMRDSLNALQAVPKMLNDMATEWRDLVNQSRSGHVDFLDAQSKQQQWSQFWTTVRWLTASAGALYVARKEQEAGRPGTFDPAKIKEYADAMHDPSAHARKIARDIRIQPEQRETFIKLVGEATVAEMDAICDLAENPHADFQAILVRIKALVEGVDPMAMMALVKHLNEEQFAAFSAIQKLLNTARGGK